MDVLYRSIVGKGAVSGVGRQRAFKMFWSRAAVVVGISSMYALAGGLGDDEDYEDMSLEKRDKTWVLGGGVGIPVPTELGILFKAIPERVVEYFRRQGTPEEQLASEATISWFKAAWGTYFGRTIPIPQAVRPLFEVTAGYSFLTGRPLEGIYHKTIDASNRTTSITSEIAKTIADFTRDTTGVEVSPISIDTFLNGYFGTTAALITATTDSLLNPNKADRPLHRMVGLAPFSYSPVGTRYLDEFYDMREKVVSANGTLNHLIKNSPESVEQYVEKNKERLALFTAVNSTLDQLSDTRAYKNWLDTKDAAEQYSSAERTKMKQEVQKEESSLVRWIREAKTELKL
jgi:hypothetical protein